ncbi:MFS transporter [Commensalibacter papalotli (ex Servin-Garciduenas et al. 2014)]|uniref:Alpha-ketoglutarate permease n=1 Tax=Commensalibacter papalotli (ex Servin-Garciduenas et al. 2014) TaxID=1208583 RepID=W7E4L3_9PROT|nr:MFS transporter [Commensalibacter papalotli (ex Servin-Garciduenas et al. 2014)]EUK18036.1 alpha-ketoglutarate permease [Commensalibacter papalotli (ex Servin-Garciduenas et al. 2014)]
MSNLINKIFVSPKLMLGYFGVMIFMAGEGLELNWLPEYLQQSGHMTQAQTGLIYTIYGLMVAISSWFSGVLAEIYGVRRVMFIGLILFYVGSFFFLTFGMPTHNLYWIIPTYAIRGLAYPLFAYGFLVWVAYEAPAEKLGSAVGIFWFMYSGGVAVIGTGYSNVMLNYYHISHLHVLWTALIFVTIGAVVALALSGGDKNSENKKTEKASFSYLLNGLTILTKKPKVAMGGIVRMINTSAAYGFPVFIPALLIAEHYDKDVWLSVVTWLWMVNVIFNLLWGIIGDKLGWRNVVMWFGCVGCAITTFLFYYAIEAHASVLTITLIASVYGCFLAAFVPLSAIMPMLAPKDKGAAMSILNFGAGMSYFFGYFIVTLFIASVGNAGVIYIYTVLYLVAACLMVFVNVGQPKTDSVEHEVAVAVKEAL